MTLVLLIKIETQLEFLVRAIKRRDIKVVPNRTGGVYTSEYFNVALHSIKYVLKTNTYIDSKYDYTELMKSANYVWDVIKTRPITNWEI